MAWLINVPTATEQANAAVRPATVWEDAHGAAAAEQCITAACMALAHIATETENVPTATATLNVTRAAAQAKSKLREAVQ